ncbi:hypothetical protein H5410_018720 [Solanum commersonii]|uniref:DRBM domain-containing protein n=1 Tax=Solanum commersonii TaxID=4109 RepID=A0A9J6A397_SOLCO|nr:hypothetical protein H5410_018720 [Solanum commersonii]
MKPTYNMGSQAKGQIPPAQVMYKNQLQEYTQKNVKQLPVYQTVNDGFPHAPKFRAKVLVDGSEYESKSTYPTKKEAEQAVAKIAYECIHNEIEARDISLIYKEPMLCKSILYEFAVKRNLDRPSSVYIRHLVLEGKTYKGELAGSKQMAKQVVAQAVIESLLGMLIHWFFSLSMLKCILCAKEFCLTP